MALKVLKFGAIWCPECAIMKPRWEKVQKDFPDLVAEFVDIDQKPAMKKDYHISHLPTYVFLGENNREIGRLSGLFEVEELLTKIKSYQTK